MTTSAPATRPALVVVVCAIVGIVTIPAFVLAMQITIWVGRILEAFSGDWRDVADGTFPIVLLTAASGVAAWGLWKGHALGWGALVLGSAVMSILGAAGVGSGRADEGIAAMIGLAFFTALVTPGVRSWVGLSWPSRAAPGAD